MFLAYLFIYFVGLAMFGSGPVRGSFLFLSCGLLELSSAFQAQWQFSLLPKPFHLSQVLM